jgi:twinkle protein
VVTGRNYTFLTKGLLLMKTHQHCPVCGHKDCRTEWSDGSYYCHSCGDKPKGFEMKEKVSVGTNLSSRRKPYRNLSQKAVDKYQIYTVQEKGKDVERLYPYPHATKKRILPKDFRDNKGFTNDHLFGMDKFNAGSSKFIVVVEGEDDAPAAYDMLGCSYPVVAIPGASISNALLKNCFDYLNAFESIVVATDGDDAGRQAAERLASSFPNKVYRVSLDKYKDPMEFLEAGAQSDFKFAFHNRQKYVPEFDTSTPDQFVSLIREEKDDEYLPSGINEYDREHLGLFQGHLTVFQAPEGTGKTELFHFFEYHLLKNYPEIPFASCHLEETKKRTVLGWASYELKENVTRKDLIKDMSKVEEAIKELTEKENAHLFSIGTDEDPIVLLDRVRYYATVCGCKYIFIEPIQDLAQQYHGAETTERFLSRIAVGLARLATELNVGILVIAHENDDGLVSDCRKLSKQASVVVRLERKMDAADEEERNTTTLWSKKNRPSSFVGFGGTLKFDPERFTLEEKFL